MPLFELFEHGRWRCGVYILMSMRIVVAIVIACYLL
ncbi:hypothetical protein XaFJ1_GM003014 [Xanthomonas albilineans]|nr:hypothetical protein XaFJ1_GM003014 [Xanthomonas albilineans]